MVFLRVYGLTFLIISSFCFAMQDFRVNQKFPWYKLPNELKWKIAQMGGSESILEEVSSKMQIKLAKIDDIDLSGCNTDISAMSPDNKIFAVASKDLKSVKFLDIEKRIFLDTQTLRADGQLKSLSWHPKKNKIAIGATLDSKVSDRIDVWNLNENKIEKSIDYTDLKGIEWYSYGDSLFLYGGKGVAHWIGDSLHQETDTSHNLIKCSSNGEWLIACRDDNEEYEQITLRNYKKKRGIELKNVDGGKLPIQAADWNDSKFAVGLESGWVQLLDTQSNCSLIINKYCEVHSKNFEQLCDCNKEQVVDVKFHPFRNVIASAYESGNIQLISYSEDKSISRQDYFQKKHRFESTDMKSINMPYKIRKIFWRKMSMVLSVLSKDRLMHYAYDSNLSQLPMKRYHVFDKTSELRKTSLDPLKLYMAARRLALVSKKGANDSIVSPDRLEKLGFQKKEIKDLIENDKAILIGPEEYDYCLFLKEQGLVFDENIIGLKGRDVCLEDFLKQNPEPDIYKNS